MIIVKLITAVLRVNDAMLSCSSDMNLMFELKAKYENRCFASCLILKVLRIVRQSECLIDLNSFGGVGTINVLMEVQAVEYITGEIINGCRVVKKNALTLICEAPYAKIVVTIKENMNSITTDQLISVQVGESRYAQTSSVINVVCIPLMYDFDPPVFKLQQFNPSAELYVDVMKRLDEEIQTSIELKKGKGWHAINRLMCAYKEPQLPKNVANIMELMKGTTSDLYVCRHPTLDFAEPNVLTYETSAEAVTELSSDAVMLLLLESYCAYLRTIREMLTIYSTESIMTAHTNLWKIFAKQKR